MSARILFMLVCVALLHAGCASTNPAEINGPYSRAYFWSDAQVVTAPSVERPYEFARVRPGVTTVLMFEEGSATLTNGSSGEIVHVTLPGDPAPGRVYEVSREAGTLAFSAWVFHEHSLADPERPAHGTVHVHSVGPGTVTAELRVTLTKMSQFQTSDGQDWRKPYSKNATITFQRAKAFSQPPPRGFTL